MINKFVSRKPESNIQRFRRLGKAESPSFGKFQISCISIGVVAGVYILFGQYISTSTSNLITYVTNLLLA